MTPSTIVVTGAGRGIGLALTRHLHHGGHRVIACCRAPGSAAELTALGVSVVELDVASTASTDALAAAIDEHTDHVDLLVNNAAVKQAVGHSWHASAGPMPHIDADAFMEVLRTNVAGTILVTQALRRHLAAARGTVVNISSQLGSLAAGVDIDYAYNVSKAALNMATVTMQRDLGRSGITAVAVNPGWIRTSMGGAAAPLDLDEATADLAELVLRIEPALGGSFVDRFGSPVPW